MALTEADWALIKATLRKAIDTTLSRVEHAELTALLGRIEAAPAEAEKPKASEPAAMDLVAQHRLQYRLLQAAAEARRQDALNDKLNASEARARQVHGDALVDKAQLAAIEAGITSVFCRAADPYADLVTWYVTGNAAASRPRT